jgi:hypothetical protein
MKERFLEVSEEAGKKQEERFEEGSHGGVERKILALDQTPCSVVILSLASMNCFCNCSGV